MTRKLILTAVLLFALCAAGLAAVQAVRERVGLRKDRSATVSTLQRIEPATIAFDGRPTDIAMHPSGQFFAVLNQKSVFLATAEGLIPGASAPLHDGAGFHGLAWSPDGARLYASVSDGYVESFDLSEKTLNSAWQDRLAAGGLEGEPAPRRDGDRAGRETPIRRRDGPGRRGRGRYGDREARARIRRPEAAVRREAERG